MREWRVSRGKPVPPPTDTKQQCRVCGESKPPAAFYLNDTCVIGVDTQCKACTTEKRKTPEGRAAGAHRMRQFRERHADDPAVKARVKAEKRRAYLKDPGKDAARQKRRLADPEVRAAQYAKNRERYHTAPGFKERERARQAAKRATPEGRARHNATNAKYKTSPKGRAQSRADAEKRRAQMLRVPHDLTPEQWNAVVAAYAGCCAYCGNPVAKPEMDHVIALACGGWHTVGNVVPACRRCNQRKNAFHLIQALKRLGIPVADYEARRAKAVSRL